MLVFKINIYDVLSSGKPIPSPCPDPDYNSCFDRPHFIEVALNQEDDVISFIERQDPSYWREDCLQFYPHAGRINSLQSLKEILNILKLGLKEKSCWLYMNAYHFSFLYDVLLRFSFNYNHDNLSEKLLSLPELEGKPLYFGHFFNNYFFNKSFLVDPDHFNSLTRQDKIRLGYDEPYLFGVVNGLAPTPEEIALLESNDYPYTLFV